MRRRQRDDIRSTSTDNQTWNDCPNCGKTWKDLIPTPGLLHRTRLCIECGGTNDAIGESESNKRSAKASLLEFDSFGIDRPRVQNT